MTFIAATSEMHLFQRYSAASQPKNTTYTGYKNSVSTMECVSMQRTAAPMAPRSSLPSLFFCRMPRG